MMFRARQKLLCFLSHKRGNVMITFALLLPVILGVVGAAVDYSAAQSKQAALQETIDSAVLAGARALANGEDYIPVVHAYIKASWPEGVAMPPYRVNHPNKYDVSLSFKTPPVVETQFLSIFGIGPMSIDSSAVGTIAPPALDIALAYDNSKSMGEAGKLGMMRSEGHRFIDKIVEFNNPLSDQQRIWISTVTFESGIAQSYQLTTYVPNMRVPLDRMKAKSNTAAGLGIRESMKWLNMSPRSMPRDKQYLVVLSDGDEDKIAGATFASECPKVRAAGVHLIVIAFYAHRSGDRQRLENCADVHNPKYKNNLIYADGQSQLGQAFDKIIASLSGVRLKR